MNTSSSSEGSLIEATRVSLLHGSAMPRILQTVTRHLVGKTVKRVGYVVIDGRPFPCIVFNDDSNLIAQCDDECNGPGVLTFNFLMKGHRSIEETMCETSLAGGAS